MSWLDRFFNPTVAPDASTTVKGIVQLGGDLQGTSSSASTPRISSITGSGGVLTVGTTRVTYNGNAKIVDDDWIVNLSVGASSTVQMFSFTTTSGKVYALRGIVSCLSSGASSCGDWAIEAFWDNVAGVVTQRAASPVNLVYRTGSVLNVAVALTGTTPRLDVTTSGSTVQWTARLYLHESTF